MLVQLTVIVIILEHHHELGYWHTLVLLADDRNLAPADEG